MHSVEFSVFVVGYVPEITHLYSVRLSLVNIEGLIDKFNVFVP